MTDADTSMLDSALAYARLGWFVVPLHTPRPGNSCSCRSPECASKGKHPRTRNGLKDASNDPTQIESWWSQWPDANIALVTGPSGLVAIDVDPRHGGDEDWKDLKQKHGKSIQHTVSSHTGGGGEHYIYLQPGEMTIGNVSNSDKYTGPLGRGIDVRAEGGYIVAPPSLHESGNRYEWYEGESPFERDPQRLPLAFAEVLSAPARQQEHTEPVSAADILKGVPEGTRDWTLFQLASKLRYADVPIDWAYALVEAAAAKSLDSKGNPFPRAEARKKVDSAYTRYNPGAGAWVSEQEAQEAQKHAGGLAGRVLLDEILREGVPPPQWLLEGELVRGFTHLLYGESGHGKTTVALSWVKRVIEAGEDVLFVDEESGYRKIAGLLQDMGVSDVDKHLHYFDAPGIGKDAIPALIEYCDEVRPSLILCDSLTDFMAIFGLNDNEAVDVATWFKAIPRTLQVKDYLPCVVLIDHVTKAKDNISHSAGSRAKRQKSDVLWHVEKTEDFNREKVGKVVLTNFKDNPGTMPAKHTYSVGGDNGTLICAKFQYQEHPGTSVPVRGWMMIEALYQAHPEPLSSGDLQVTAGVDRRDVWRVIQGLINRGWVEKFGENRRAVYALTPEGTVAWNGRTVAWNGSEEEGHRSVGEPPPL